MSHTPTPARRAPGLRTIILLVLTAAILATVLAGGAALYLLRAEPPYWTANRRQLDALSPRQTRDIADALERRLRAWLRNADADAAGPMRVTLSELNAWMHVHGRDALQRMGAPGVDRLRHPMAAVEDGRLILAGEVRVSDVPQIVSLVTDVESRPDGMLWMRVGEVRGGRLPVPGGAVAAAGDSIQPLRQELAEQHRALADELTAGRLCDPRPLLDLFDAPPDTQLGALTLEPRGLTVTLRRAPSPPVPLVVADP